jgi:hypothetical protein
VGIHPDGALADNPAEDVERLLLRLTASEDLVFINSGPGARTPNPIVCKVAGVSVIEFRSCARQLLESRRSENGGSHPDGPNKLRSLRLGVES